MRLKKVSKKQTVIFVLLIALSFIYALPNFYNKAPSVVIIPKDGTSLTVEKQNEINKALIDLGKLKSNNDTYEMNFSSIENQMKGYENIKNILDTNDYYINLTLLATSPEWLNSFSAKSTSLGLDLMGGVHFLMEVDIEDIKEKTLLDYKNNILLDYTEDKINIKETLNDLTITPYSKKLDDFLVDKYLNILDIKEVNNSMVVTLNSVYLKNTIDSAVKQNIFTLKNRVNELGVAEPIVQREGVSRIVVQLPGIQDTEKARDLIGTTASLSFRELKEDGLETDDAENITERESGLDYLFYKKPIIDGKTIIDASSGLNPETSAPLVSVTLNSEGGGKMLDFTTENVGKMMGSVLVETAYSTVVDDRGVKTKNKTVTKNAINIARVQGAFSTRFQITGLNDKDEAHKLAILLRSGSLAAPVDIIEERTIGPNMGAENIDNGKKSIMIGFLLVLLLMVLKYRSLGLVANFCVIINLLLLLSFLSMLGATLTLPGLAGILLTVGMAVDGNVVIFERIKEEYKKTENVAKSIKNGYDKAFSTIIDANITTFIAAFILFIFGTGPVKGFAVTLSIGIITSIITSVYLSRYIVETFFSNKKELKI